MRKWKCIEVGNDKQFTNGKIYATEEDGTGLISDDGQDGWCNPSEFYVGCGIGAKFEEVKDFTLADLKPCMVVVRRDGSVCGMFQIKDRLNLQDGLGYACCDVEDYSHDLKSKWEEYDIMKVYGFSESPFDISINGRELLWERIEKSPQQIKLEELETKQREIADEMAKLRKEME